eukprot:TRINITY_DN30972_c0_g1_i1.p1 TRINITY_DN30972_c0_g1~~TRINITY_DN30972_c0_g1_i1.p1  ORF type:complete len:238 (+),score=46.62 TRINITY_DN30972_c0_g1_i1:81-794(+)
MAGPGATAEAAWGHPALPFVGVGYVKDGAILAFHSCVDAEDQQELHKDVFRKLLGVAPLRLQKGERTRLQWDEGSVCCLMDQQGTLLYVVMTTMIAYPERLAYQLLYDLVVAVQQHQGANSDDKAGSQQEAVQRCMRDLVTQYEDPSNFPALQAAIDRVSRPRMSHDGGLAVSSDTMALSALDRRKSTLIKVAMAFLAFLILVYFAFGRRQQPDSSGAPQQLQQAFLGTDQTTSATM